MYPKQFSKIPFEVPNPSYSYLSEIETAILKSDIPVEINETDEITVLGQQGIWANKAEVINWKGFIPIHEYVINEDKNPSVITKQAQQKLTYIQELAVRYLKPPSPPIPGDIIIQQEPSVSTNPAPPLILRQQPPRPTTPAPLVIREQPPAPLKYISRKVITISGKILPPPPRKVVIERLAPLPSKPQSVIIERWLPYNQVKRRVIYQKSSQKDPVMIKPKNVIVQWEAPSVTIKKDFKYLGIIRANPVEYVERYGPTLKNCADLPEFVLEIKPPNGVVLAADQINHEYELEGDVQALKLIDLDQEGLSEYKIQLSEPTKTLSSSEYSMRFYDKIYSSDSIDVKFNLENALVIISEIFSQVDQDKNGMLSINEAQRLFLRLNSRLGRGYGGEDVSRFFRAIDVDRDGFISLKEFRVAFERLL